MNGLLLPAGIVCSGLAFGAAGAVEAIDAVVMGVSPGRARALVEEDRPGAIGLVGVVEKRAVVNTLTRFASLCLRFSGIVYIVGIFWEFVGEDGGRWWLPAVAIFLVLSAFFAQQIFRRLFFRSDPERIALRVAPVLALLLRLVAPFTQRKVGGLFAPETVCVETPRAGLHNSIDYVVGDDSPDRVQMIDAAVRFSGMVAREIMIPRPDVQVLDVDCTVESAWQFAKTTGFHVIPVHDRGGVDHILGLLHVRDFLFSLQSDDPPLAVRPLLRHAFFVPEQKHLADLFREMCVQECCLSIVIDEYGGVAGIVTLADLCRELAGQASCERDQEDWLIKAQENGLYRVAGRTLIDNLAVFLGVDFALDETDTAGGAMLFLLGRIPAQGESVLDTHSGVVFTAAVVEDNRILELDVHMLAPPGGTAKETVGEKSMVGDEAGGTAGDAAGETMDAEAFSPVVGDCETEECRVKSEQERGEQGDRERDERTAKKREERAVSVRRTQRSERSRV